MPEDEEDNDAENTTNNVDEFLSGRESMNKFHYVGIVLLTSVFMTVSTHTAAASTTLASLGPMIVTPTPTPTPSITTPNTDKSRNIISDIADSRTVFCG